MSEVHIGKTIKQVLDHSSLTVKDFAGKIFLSRSGVNKLFAREHIQTAQLKKISEILGHDFFMYYHDDLYEGAGSPTKFTLATRDDIESLKAMLEILTKKIDKLLPVVDIL